MHAVNLRLAPVYGRGGRGNLNALARALRAGWFPVLPETGNRRSLVHVDDVVTVMRLVADSPSASGRTYIVGDPQAYSGRQLCEAILAVPPPRRFSWPAPAWMLQFGARAGDLAEKLLRRPFPLNSDVLSRLLGSACYSPARLERDLGWRAQVGLQDGLQEMLAPARAGT